MNVFVLPWPQGTRVRVIAEHAPACRTGVIWQHRPENGGYLVQHDEPGFTEGLFAGRCLFGWSYNELELEKT